ncbi:MAG: glycosyl hydrolase [Eubacteriales bacterium]|nr:glycosyl hydrolase [Eubacteriales bacterium]
MTKKKKTAKKITTGILAAILASSMPVQGIMVRAAEAEGAAQETILSSYLNGKSATGLMARYWFPDAGAGYDADGDGIGDGITQVRDMILDMIEAGFGGCELTMLLDSADYGMLSDEKYQELGFTDAEDAIAKIGWGSEAWANIIACATDTANQYNEEHGTEFKVDVTITAHWPMIINNIAPNDDEQQQALVYTTQKLTAAELENGVDLALPEMKTTDTANSSSMTSTYIFKDTLVSSTIVKYSGEESETTTNFFTGQDETTTYPLADFASFTDVTNVVSTEDGYEAGVPKADAKYMKLVKDESGESYHWNYYASAEEINPDYSDAEDYIVLEKGTDKLYGGNLKVETATSMAGVVYTVTDQDTGETVPEENYDVIDKGSIVSLYEDEEGNSCAKAVTPETAEDVQGLITVSNRHFLGDREEMADTQQLYSVSSEQLEGLVPDEAKSAIEAAEGEELKEGDYILINVYRRGTGQVASGGGNIPMTNKTYAVDYFSEAGAKKVIEYWEEKLFPHVYTREDGTTATLQEIMEKNNATIFEDSIELSHSDGNLWSADLLESIQAETGLDALPYMPVIAGWRVTNDETGEAGRITEDYKETLNQTYTKYHLGTISDWTNTFGYGFRTQCHGIDAVDAGTAALSTDIAESDNATDGFGTRVYAGAKNVNPDNNVISNESLTFGTGFGEFPSWYYSINTLNRYFSEGVNRVILHGTPFKTSYTKTSTADSSWPGWDFMSFMAWNSRQTWWDEVEVFSDYIDRVQSILQDGESKIPVAVLEDPSISNVTQINTGVGLSKAVLQEMIGNGYNYNIITRGLLESDNASLNITQDSLSGNTVLSELAEYQVLVLDHITSMSVEAMEKLVGYGQAGLKIVNIGSDITKVYGTDEDGTQDAKIQELFKTLKDCDTYYEITSDDEAATADDGITQAETDMLAYISENVDSGVSYSASSSTAVNDKGSKWLETTRIYDETDGTNYYLMYNESGVSVGAEQDASFGPASWEENGDITTTVTLAGDGVPYILDPADGSVTAIKDYKEDEGKLTFDLQIQEGDLLFVAVGDNEKLAENAAEQQADKTEQETIELGKEQSWMLALNSYSPDDSQENTSEDGNLIDPTKSKITTISLETPLKVWGELELTKEDLDTLGVESADSVSGTGDYSVEVEVGDYGTESIGAVLNYDYDVQYNNITRITVTNSEGTTTEFDGINPNHKYMDLGTVLTPGKNTITIRVCGDLSNRANDGQPAAASPFPSTGDGQGSANGLTDASLELYTTGE